MMELLRHLNLFEVIRFYMWFRCRKTNRLTQRQCCIIGNHWLYTYSIWKCQKLVGKIVSLDLKDTMHDVIALNLSMCTCHKNVLMVWSFQINFKSINLSKIKMCVRDSIRLFKLSQVKCKRKKRSNARLSHVCSILLF